jgi:UDP-N-acetylglucosamine 2-epimerase (non-hydrolysing)
MKVVTIFGTRPEIIRLSKVAAQLDKVCRHITVFTGQNYDPALSDIFFSELQMRRPDVNMAVAGATSAARIARILEGTEAVLTAERPDRVLVLGDTDSALSAFIAKRLGIPVFHMEAGNRCFDDAVPEEVNRRLIDHASDVLMPYTERSRQNLLAEGIHSSRIFVTGNPIGEVIDSSMDRIGESVALDRMGVQPRGYGLVTVHRAENVDRRERLDSIIEGLRQVQAHFGFPIICIIHPRTRKKLDAFGIGAAADGQGGGLIFAPPLGFHDFVQLERHARLVLTDSGTVQEECAIFGVPQVILRTTTERPEIREGGASILAGVDADAIRDAAETALIAEGAWTIPAEYQRRDVAATVVKLVLSYHPPHRP